MAPSTERLIGNGVVVTLDDESRVLTDGAVLVEGDRIAEVGATADLRRAHPEAELIDAGGRTILPGFVCAHHHFYSAFACGLASRPAKSFVEILQSLWWRLDRALGEEDLELSALICIARAISRGTTTIFDHHSSPSALRGSLDRLGEVVSSSGIRASLCYEITERHGPEAAEQAIEASRAFLDRARADQSGRLQGMVGVHASMTVGQEILERAIALAHSYDVGLHIHVAEDQADQRDSLEKHGERVVERLDRAGALNKKTLAVHGVWLDDREIDLLREHRATVIHCPQSNMNNGVGAARVLEMMRRGVRVGLGSDGMTSDMLEEARVALFLIQHDQERPPAGIAAVGRMLLETCPAIASEMFSTRLGTLSPGAAADIIISDHVPFTPISPENVVGHVLFGVSQAPVDSTIVAGRVLMHHKELKTIDWEEICQRAARLSPQTWERFEKGLASP
jgi:putative selenium metabolism protein SsnA